MTLKLIKLLDRFEEPIQERSRVWNIFSLLRLGGKVVQAAYQKAFFVPQWYLLFDLNDQISTSFSSFRKVLPPKDRFWADPHVLRAGERYYIFVEEYIHRLKKGHISVIEMDEDGNYRDPVPVLERGYHLSYPFVFDWEGKYYMVPESAASAAIELYECLEFPDKWELKMNLMENVHAVDTTLFHDGDSGRWWLFAGMADEPTSLSRVQLCLFFSDNLLTNQWMPHPLNPIVSDLERARPAGKVFTMDGKTIRPSQDCSRHYGYGVDLNEISLLSTSDYAERSILAIRPGWDKKAQRVHTFTHEGRLTVIDAFTRFSRF